MRVSMVAMFGVLGLSLAGIVFADDAEKDMKKFEGTWTLVRGEADGKVLTEEQLKGGKLVIKGDHYTAMIPGMETVTGTQKLDPSKSPKSIDISDDSGSNKGKTCLGIYEFKGDKGDEFHCAFAPPGKARPAKFATAADSGQWFHVWKKTK